jgi:hypothetical protein
MYVREAEKELGYTPKDGCANSLAFVVIQQGKKDQILSARLEMYARTVRPMLAWLSIYPIIFIGAFQIN